PTFSAIRLPQTSALFPYTTLFRSQVLRDTGIGDSLAEAIGGLPLPTFLLPFLIASIVRIAQGSGTVSMITAASVTAPVMIIETRSEEHTSELQSRFDIVCRLLLEK